MTEEKILILLATYNGEKYIAQQLESLLRQTYTNWQLLIRDDKSTDNTINILLKYKEKNTDKFFLIEDTLGNLGSVQNFNALLQYAKNAAFIMFCDQDDVWLPDKIADTLKEMIRLEQKYGTETPLLLHTNFLYVDSLLNIIESKKNFQATKIVKPIFPNVLCQNSVYGCTMMINQKLAEVTQTIPVEAENHDYWLAMVASAFGKIFYLNKRTVLYRQTGQNLSTQFNYNSLLNRFKRNVIDQSNFDDVKNKLKMALIFKNIYYSRLSESNKKAIDDFIQLSREKSLPLLIRNIKNGIRRQTFNQTLLFYLTLILLKKNSIKL